VIDANQRRLLFREATLTRRYLGRMRPKETVSDPPGTSILFTMSNIARPTKERANLALDNEYPTRPAATAIPQEEMVELDGIEPTTSCLQSTRSPN
jgi:hypothetical protein